MRLPEVHREGVRIRLLGRQRQFYGYLLPQDSYPVATAERERYLANFSELLAAVHKLHGGVRQECLLQVWKLHHEAASKQVSGHGAAWMPVVGVGVWPHKEPPHVWTVEEFKEFVPGVMPRPPIFMVFRLTGRPDQRSNVVPLMAGRGVLIYAGIEGDPERFYSQCNEYFRTFITEPLHLAYPFFFPLIDGATLPAIIDSLAERLLGPVRYYVRESGEDGGIGIWSQSELEPVMEELGFEVQRNE